MAEEEIAVPSSSWLREEPLEAESSFSLDGMGEIPFSVVGRIEDWEVVLLSASDRVCSEYENHVFPMYEVVFRDMGFHLPFSEFQREVFRWSKLSPSQMHPNSYAFIRAFELVCQHLAPPPLKMFSSPSSLSNGGPTGFLSFKPRRSLKYLRGRCGV